MKKFFILIALFALVSTASFGQVTGIIKGGLNLSTWNGGDADGAKTLVGGRVGVGIEYPLSEMFSIQPTLYLSHKGVKYEQGTSNAKVHEWYFDLPVDLQMRFNVAQGTNLVVGAGPYIAYGAFGKAKGTGSLFGATVSREEDTFGDNGVKHFDAGLNFEAGLEFGQFLVGGSYQLGLTKLHENVNSYNSNFCINVGYKF